jgi:hypothetical protein
MPVWVDGQTVRGYKREQFADAWHRVLGVRDVRDVGSGSSTDAAPNAPNAPNAIDGEGAKNGDAHLTLDDDAIAALGKLPLATLAAMHERGEL